LERIITVVAVHVAEEGGQLGKVIVVVDDLVRIRVRVRVWVRVRVRVRVRSGFGFGFGSQS
jgi:preprotein translocase subunit YajC